MQKIIFVLILIFLISCTNNDPIQPINDPDQSINVKTFFSGYVGNKYWESDGIAYSKEESQIHIRGFLGTSGSHYQIDIVLKNSDNGNYSLDSSVVFAGISNVVGMDAIGATYIPLEQSYIKVEYDEKKEYVSGNIDFNGFSQSYDDTIHFACNFKIIIDDITKIWTCDFDQSGISNCRFLE